MVFAGVRSWLSFFLYAFLHLMYFFTFFQPPITSFCLRTRKRLTQQGRVFTCILFIKLASQGGAESLVVGSAELPASLLSPSGKVRLRSAVETPPGGDSGAGVSCRSSSSPLRVRAKKIPFLSNTIRLIYHLLLLIHTKYLLLYMNMAKKLNSVLFI